MTYEEKLAQAIDADIKIKQIQIDKFLINYIVCGVGPPLLLIHGANIGWGMWFRNIKELSKNFTIYAIDLPGAGRSSKMDYSQLDPERDMLQIVNKIIDSLKLENFNILGASIGGWIALRIVMSHPEKINKVILSNSVGLANYMGLSDKIIGFYPFAKFISQTILRPVRNNKLVEKFLRGTFYNKKLFLPEEFIDYFYETMAASHNLLFISRLTQLTKRLILEDYLSKINNRTLIIWGENDQIMPLKKNLTNFNLIPNISVEIMEQSGHFPSIEQPDEFNKVVENFLLE